MLYYSPCSKVPDFYLYLNYPQVLDFHLRKVLQLTPSRYPHRKRLHYHRYSRADKILRWQNKHCLVPCCPISALPIYPLPFREQRLRFATYPIHLPNPLAVIPFLPSFYPCFRHPSQRLPKSQAPNLQLRSVL